MSSPPRSDAERLSASAAPPALRVWDLLLRVLHWSLVAAVALAWTTTEWFTGLHEAVGYAGLAVVAVRVLWGFAGPRRARFSDFVRGPRATWRYAARLARGHAPRHVGHNPLGAWMMLALLACIVALALTGWLYRSDRFWGEVWLDVLHQAIAWSMLVLIAVHVAGAIVTGWRHRENLVRAMITGRKRKPEGEDVD